MQYSEPGSAPLPFLSGVQAERLGDNPRVVVAREPVECCRWLREAPPAVQWLQVDNLLGQPEVWAAAARRQSGVALDVVMSDPAVEYPLLYRLVDVRSVRGVRVTIPGRTGVFKALRLAAAIQLPVRLLPGQPDCGTLVELMESVEFYLHDPMVVAPVEFFHSALSRCRGSTTADLWMNLEQDPAVFQHFDEQGRPAWPGNRAGVDATSFVGHHFKQLESDGAECASCRWGEYCRGYFKFPDAGYSCEGIVQVLDRLDEAAQQMEADLANLQRHTEASGDASTVSRP